MKKDRIVEDIKRKLPSSVQIRLRPFWRKGRNLIMRLKALTNDRMSPSFLIVGVKKGGTTSLFHYLEMNPSIMNPFYKEIDFFTSNWVLDKSWYKAHFPRMSKAVSGGITGEASPSYLESSLAANRIASEYPDMKIIVILRNPIYRAISHYFHEKKIGWESRPIEQALFATESYEYPVLDDELELKLYQAYMYSTPGNATARELVEKHPRNHAYIRYGMYADHLQYWYDRFPRDQILVLSSEQLFKAPATILATCEEFLGVEKSGIDDFFVFNEGKKSKQMPEELIQKLEDIYREPNERLKEMTGKDFGW